MSPDSGTRSPGRRRAVDGSRSRATWRQCLEVGEAAIPELLDRIREVGEDRRSGWRANKAKGNRRSRRYENRLLNGIGGTLQREADE